MTKHLSEAARKAIASTDWARRDAMADDGIMRQIAENPDAAPDMAPEIDVRAIKGDAEAVRRALAAA